MMLHLVSGMILLQMHLRSGGFSCKTIHILVFWRAFLHGVYAQLD